MDSKISFTTGNAIKIYLLIGIAGGILVSGIVIICVVISNSLKTPFDHYINTKKSLYVWNYQNAENFIKFLTDHKFYKVYFYIGCLERNYNDLIRGNLVNTGDSDPKELIKNLTDKNIEVDLFLYLNDDPDNFANIANMPKIAQALGELQKTLKFNALHLDIAPDNEKNYEALLKTYEDCREYINVSAILKPKWLYVNMTELEGYFTSSDYYKNFKDCETYADAIMKITNDSDLMAYSNTYDGVDKFLKKFDEIRDRHRSNVAKPILQLGPNITNDSLILRSNEDKDEFFKYFINVSKNYIGATIHHYEVWYEDLYCETPNSNSSYYFGAPKAC